MSIFQRFLFSAWFIFYGHDVFSQGFSMESATSYPFPSQLTVARTGSRFAVAVNEQGRRNIYTGEGPSFALKKVTAYDTDQGQELTGIRISADGERIIFVRGGDHGAYEESVPRDPSSASVPPKVAVMSMAFAGGSPVMLGEGDEPVLSPDSRQVIFLRQDEAWVCPADGSLPARRLFYTRGKTVSASWSPDGKQVLFVASRKDHAFIGIFRDSLSPIQWLAPAFAKDGSPRWSPDGKQVVFVRTPPSVKIPDSLTVSHIRPWSLMLADVATGETKEIWKSPATLRGSIPETQGGYNLHWAAGGRIVFVSYQDGWPHVYSLLPGSKPVLLTPGNYMTEQIEVSSDGKWIVACANTGPDAHDNARRHIIRMAVDKPGVQMITSGDGIESFPFVTGDGKNILLISADARRPAATAVVPIDGGKIKLTGSQLIPPDYPATQFVVPKPVSFRSSDGLEVQGQLYEPGGAATKRPAILFIHGGPERQMLLGWHYGDYYSNTYALNQYLVGQGFIVLDVNYRLGIGYGFEFQNPAHAYINGASEYLDIKAAGQWLAAQPQVDAGRIGVYGGSYGGYLTALALAKDSKLFKAGVDIHGMHNLTNYYPSTNGEQAPDAALARQLIWTSSPVAWLDGWTSPVLLIHGDDDGNVEFSESLDLVNRFQKKGFEYESLVIPDETHHWLKYSHILKVDKAVADFFKRKL